MATYRASLENLYAMLAYIRAAAYARGFSLEVIVTIELAAEEALVNIINYAYPMLPVGSGEIIITLNPLAHPAGLSIKISDSGLPYNPLQLKQSNGETTQAAERTVGGYGIYYILRLMDAVVYEHDGRCNHLSLTKYL